MASPLGKLRHALGFLLVILAANFMVGQRVKESAGQKLPDGKGGAIIQAETPEADVTTNAVQQGPIGEAVATGNGINYHGGPVMKANPVPIFVIWYGNWNGTGSNTQATVSTVEHFIGTLGNTPYERIATTYGDTTGNVSGNVSFAGHTFVNSTANLTDTTLRTTVTNAINRGALPRNGNALYVVLSSSNINETSGFCTQFCGFHTHTNLGGTDIKYAFVGNPDRCPTGCEAQTTGPNSPATGVGGADGIINILTHEQFEAITDPDLNAWFDASGEENGDKCNFNFGTTQTCAAGSICSAAGKAAGAKFNQSFGGNDYLMQTNWKNSGGGGCVPHL